MNIDDFIKNELRNADKVFEAYSKFDEPKESKSNASKKRSKISRPKVSSRFQKFFPKGTQFITEEGHTKSWAKGMSLRGGKDGNFNWTRGKYFDSRGNIRMTSSKEKWGAKIDKGNKNVCILNGTKGWQRQLQISIYQLALQAENFRVMVGHRAIQVFRDSIKYQQFYSANAPKWPALSEYTLKKRAKRHKSKRCARPHDISHILREFGDLEASIVLDTKTKGFTRVYTKEVSADPKKYKSITNAYGGWHNEGKGHYGPSSTKYKKRQFMGHSSHLNPFTDNFLRTMMKRYLFDSVFLMRKV